MGPGQFSQPLCLLSSDDSQEVQETVRQQCGDSHRELQVCPRTIPQGAVREQQYLGAEEMKDILYFYLEASGSFLSSGSSG